MGQFGVPPRSPFPTACSCSLDRPKRGAALRMLHFGHLGRRTSNGVSIRHEVAPCRQRHQGRRQPHWMFSAPPSKRSTIATMPTECTSLKRSTSSAFKLRAARGDHVSEQRDAHAGTEALVTLDHTGRAMVLTLLAHVEGRERPSTLKADQADGRGERTAAEPRRRRLLRPRPAVPRRRTSGCP